jgi:hypothetical protein
MYGYIPNAPGEMKSAPPRDHSPLSEGSLAAALPKGKDAVEQIATAHLLSIPTEAPLGIYHPAFFAGHPEVIAIVSRFEKRLAEVSGAIEARNSQMEVAYTYLDPKRLYPSIEI